MLTPGGYVITSSPTYILSTASVHFAGPNCTGKTAMTVSPEPSGTGLRARAYYGGGALYGHDGVLAKPLSAGDKVNFTTKSLTSGAVSCASPSVTQAPQPLFPAHKLTLKEIGWTAMPTMPLAIVP